MKYKLIAIDLDGTLLNSKKEITAPVKRAVAMAAEQGIHVVLATGRIVGEAVEFAREIHCENLMVTAGGAAIASASDERILESWSIPYETGAQAVEEVQNRPVRLMIYIGSKVYTNPFSDHYFKQNYRVEGFHSNKIVLDDIAAHIRERQLPVTKIYALGEQNELENALKTIHRLPDISITSSGSDNFEIMPGDADKGRALLRIGEMLGIRAQEMAAIGDSDNDIAMLKAVGMPVAMGNANPGLKALAGYITADCDNDGVAQAIFDLFL